MVNGWTDGVWLVKVNIQNLGIMVKWRRLIGHSQLGQMKTSNVPLVSGGGSWSGMWGPRGRCRPGPASPPPPPTPPSTRSTWARYWSLGPSSYLLKTFGLVLGGNLNKSHWQYYCYMLEKFNGGNQTSNGKQFGTFLTVPSRVRRSGDSASSHLSSDETLHSEACSELW